MTITAIREKLHHYIDSADDKKLEFLNAIFEDEFIDSSDLWNDPAFLNEMKSRIDEFESGVDKGRDWNEILEEVKITYGR